MSSEVQAAIRYWPRVAPLLAPPRSKAAYRRLVDALDAVLDALAARTNRTSWRVWRITWATW